MTAYRRKSWLTPTRWYATIGVESGAVAVAMAASPDRMDVALIFHLGFILGWVGLALLAAPRDR